VTPCWGALQRNYLTPPFTVRVLTQYTYQPRTALLNQNWRHVHFLFRIPTKALTAAQTVFKVGPRVTRTKRRVLNYGEEPDTQHDNGHKHFDIVINISYKFAGSSRSSHHKFIASTLNRKLISNLLRAYINGRLIPEPQQVTVTRVL